MMQLALGLGAAAVAVAVAVVPFWASARDRRRQRYGDAAAALVRWHEYPFRIARRTSDDAAELARLADIGHDLQEALAQHRAWLNSESPKLGSLYGTLTTEVYEWVRAAATKAWDRPPIRKASEMNIKSLAAKSAIDIEGIVKRFASATELRFGFRRIRWREFGRRTSSRATPGEAP